MRYNASMIKTFASLFIGLLIWTPISYGQSDSVTETWLHQGTVTDILETTYPMIHGREVEFQTLQVELSDGSVRTDVYNDYVPASVGDWVYLSLSYDPITESEGLFVEQVDRVSGLFWVIVVFVLVYLLIGGIKGLRSLAALGVAIGSVWFILLPALQAGYDPLWVGVGIAALVLGAAMFITHGFTVVSLVSYTGSMIAIGATILFAWWAMGAVQVSGLVGGEASTLSMIYGPTIDLFRLLLAGMIIGILGVMDDVAVMQAAMVREFMTEPGATVGTVFMRAMRVGREHAAALVNTLVLAYTAVALPLFLVVFSPAMNAVTEIPLRMHVSNEIFVVEFIRSIVGSFGLVLTVPIVTALAVVLYHRYPPKKRPGETGPACMHHMH